MRACPVAVGEKWKSMKSNGMVGEVIEVKSFDGDWAAKLRMSDHRSRWVTCTDHGLFGYRVAK